MAERYSGGENGDDKKRSSKQNTSVDFGQARGDQPHLDVESTTSRIHSSQNQMEKPLPKPRRASISSLPDAKTVEKTEKGPVVAPVKSNHSRSSSAVAFSRKDKRPLSARERRTIGGPLKASTPMVATIDESPQVDQLPKPLPRKHRSGSSAMIETTSTSVEGKQISTIYVVTHSKEDRSSIQEKTVFKWWNREIDFDKDHRAVCHVLSEQFPNIFQIEARLTDEKCKTIEKKNGKINGKLVKILVGANCCFIEEIPKDLNSNSIESAIKKLLEEFKRIDYQPHIYVQIAETIRTAVVLVSPSDERWTSLNSIELNGKMCRKVNELTTPSQFLHESDYAYSVPAINEETWYNTEMQHGGTTITDYTSQQDHKIFRMRWDADAFLRQLGRWATPTDQAHDPEREKLANKQRHLIRMTVMLNTYGIIKRKQYEINGRQIQLKLDSIRTVLYKHESVLSKATEIESVNDIQYPYESTRVSVVNNDCLVAYQNLVSEGYRPLLLNMANAYSPGGGYRKGDGAQEENVFRRSDYFRSLDVELEKENIDHCVYFDENGLPVPMKSSEKLYPMDEFGAIYSSGLTVFRKTEAEGYELMEEPMHNVCAIAMAAYRVPQLTSDHCLEKSVSLRTRKKIENIFKIALHQKHDCLVLSALGCGAFRNPPRHVAKIFLSVIQQFAGFFKFICFAIIDDHNTGKDLNRNGNFLPFKMLLNQMEYKPLRIENLRTAVGPYLLLKSSGKSKFVLSEIRILTAPFCRYGSECRNQNDRDHRNQYSHPPLCPFLGGTKPCDLDDDPDHHVWFSHPFSIDYPTQNAVGPSAPRDKKFDHEMPVCPRSPYHCKIYDSLFDQTKNHSDSSGAQKHCREYLHICPFGSQCSDKSAFHLQTTIHIEKTQCRYEKNCSMIGDEQHMNMFTHPGIPDIRQLCPLDENQCQRRAEVKHLVQFRHARNEPYHSVIRYFYLDDNAKFMSNQQRMLANTEAYMQRHSIKIKRPMDFNLKNFVRKFSPVYQCSLSTFEFILASGCLLSRKQLEQMKEPRKLMKFVLEQESIKSIICNNSSQFIEDFILSIIQELRSNHQENHGANKIPEKEETAGSQLNAANIKEIRDFTTRLTKAALNLQLDSSDQSMETDETLTAHYGPHAFPDAGDVILVLRRDIMHHPGSNFTIRPSHSFADRTADQDRPWERPTGTTDQQFHQSKLHCGILGYEDVILHELLLPIYFKKKSTEIDTNELAGHLEQLNSGQILQAHLPRIVPIDYIESIFLPKSAALRILDTFRDQKNNFPGDLITFVNENYCQVAAKHLRSICLGHTDSSSNQRGIILTLEASKFQDLVRVPFTIGELFENYREKHRHGDLSNDIYIYWKAKFGDMMITLSEDLLDSHRGAQALICYITGTPSTEADDDEQSVSYLHFGNPKSHEETIGKGLPLAFCQNFHAGSKLDCFNDYCLKIEKLSGKVTLSHVGTNSVYNEKTIFYQFAESTVPFKRLNYIHLSAGEKNVPIRNLLICFHAIPEMHPSFKRIIPGISQEASPSSSIYDKVSSAVGHVGSMLGFTYPKNGDLKPCPDSINCQLQTDVDHSKKFSHPCRFAELCREKEKEPYLTHEPRNAPRCSMDERCARLTDPCHRAQFRHTGYSYFLIPCRNKTRCTDLNYEHRVKYSHGENLLASSSRPSDERSSALSPRSEMPRSDATGQSYYYSQRPSLPPGAGSRYGPADRYSSDYRPR